MISKGINISELGNIDNNTEKVFGVVVDDFATEINNNLSEISIIAQDNGEKELDIDVIDSILAYITSGVHVTLEIPFELEFDPSNIVILASSSRFSLSVIPPEGINENEELLNQYAEKIKSFVDPWIGNPMSQTEIIPFTGYFSYLVSKELGHTPESLSTDDYMVERFVKALSNESSEALKEILYQYVVDYFGGKEEFSQLAHTLGYVIYDYTDGEMQITREEMKKEEE